MKNLYRKGKVHPSPSSAHVGHHQSTDPILSLLLCSLPSTILALSAALSKEDRQVLAYLLNNSNNYNYMYSNCKTHSSSSSSSFGNKKKSPEEKKGEHPPLFDCSCFRCYTSFWVRWDSSPNRHLIHEILEAFEDSLHKAPKSRKQQQQNQRRKQGRRAEEDRRESESSGEVLKESCLDSEDVGLGEEDGVEEGEKSGTVGRYLKHTAEDGVVGLDRTQLLDGAALQRQSWLGIGTEQNGG
ncbi:hypothetical protein ACLOJK_035801, partial [Asimina triloba]